MLSTMNPLLHRPFPLRRLRGNGRTSGPLKLMRTVRPPQVMQNERPHPQIAPIALMRSPLGISRTVTFRTLCIRNNSACRRVQQLRRNLALVPFFHYENDFCVSFRRLGKYVQEGRETRDTQFKAAFTRGYGAKGHPSYKFRAAVSPLTQKSLRYVPGGRSLSSAGR